MGGKYEEDKFMRTWETFCDDSYYHMWAVRPVGDEDFTSQLLFHVMSLDEAQALCDLLNDLEEQ